MCGQRQLPAFEDRMANALAPKEETWRPNSITRELALTSWAEASSAHDRK